MAKNKKQNFGLTDQQKHAFDHEVISWTAPLYAVHEKSRRWYIIAGIVTALLIAHAIYTEAWTFAVVILTTAYVYVYSHSSEPKQEKIIISEIGIKEGPHYYPYSSIKGFWIIYHPPFVKQLHLQTHRKMMSEIVIQLVDQDPVEVRNYLCGQIAEFEGKEETLVDLLARRLKL